MTDWSQDMREISSPDSTLWPRRLRLSSRTTKGSRSRTSRSKTTLAASHAACPTPPSLPAKRKSEHAQSMIYDERRQRTYTQPAFCIWHDPAMPSSHRRGPNPAFCTIPASFTLWSRAVSSMALFPTGGWFVASS